MLLLSPFQRLLRGDSWTGSGRVVTMKFISKDIVQLGDPRRRSHPRRGDLQGNTLQNSLPSPPVEKACPTVS